MSDSETIPPPGPEAAAALRDEALPSASVLLGPGASAVLAAAVADRGGTIESLRARFVLYTPGSRIAVRYSARVAWPGGRTTHVTLAATERSGGPPEGSVPVEVAGTTVGVWRWPLDPRLPGLRRATDSGFVRGLLDEFGAPPGPINLSYAAYWPGRRAVIQAVIPQRGLRFDPATGKLGRPSAEKLLFIKVVRPSQVEGIYRRHAALHGTLPVARALGWSKDLGLLVIEALPGQTISACLKDVRLTPPAPAELLGLLRGLEPFDLGGHRQRTTSQKIARHVSLLKAVLPDQADALDRFAETYGEQREQPLVTVHGDFHEEQVLTEGGRISGLLDIDDAGPGQLVDDLALMIGRVRARAHFTKGSAARIEAYERALLDTFSRAVDPDELRRRAAGALLGRATGPFRSQAKGWPRQSRERIRLAEDWLGRWARESGRA